MSRSLSRVILGFAFGLIVALAISANRTHNTGLAATFLGWALVGAAILALMLLAAAIAARAEGRDAAAEPDAEIAAAVESAAAPPTTEVDPAAVSAIADASASRIALLEARLAVEEQELEVALAAMAAADSAVTDHAARADGDEPIDPDMRERVLETVAGLVSRGQNLPANELVREVEHLLQDAS